MHTKQHTCYAGRFCSYRNLILKLLKRYSKTKHRAPAYSRALRRIRGVVNSSLSLECTSSSIYAQFLDQECTTRGSWAGSGLWTCYIRPLEQITFLLNDGHFMNEFKLHWTVNNFATSYNLKQLWWQQYQTTAIKRHVK